MLDIDFDFINSKLSPGLKLRFDIGTSTTMPYGIQWLEEDKNVFVIGIEPHPDHFVWVKEELKKSGYEDRCYLIEAAIDDVKVPTKKVFYGLDGPETGECDNTLSGYNTGTSSLKKPIGSLANSIEQVYNVNVISLKNILDRLNYFYVDYIKIDTQGNDLSVIKSLGHHIKNVMEIQTEYDSTPYYEFANSGEDLDNFLYENDFKKCEPVLWYFTDENNNQMYQISDYKYRNFKLKINT